MRHGFAFLEILHQWNAREDSMATPCSAARMLSISTSSRAGAAAAAGHMAKGGGEGIARK
jgi:hypothetical protein